MKNTPQRRTRSRGGRRNNNNKARVYDSNGPDVRIRGTASQIVEKYATLAKDASASGDIVMAQNFLQHAEHYQRLVNDWDAELAGKPRQSAQQHNVRASKDVSDDSIGNRVEEKSEQSEDLGLPSSILGEAAPVDEVKSVKTKKVLEAEPA